MGTGNNEPRLTREEAEKSALGLDKLAMSSAAAAILQTDPRLQLDQLSVTRKAQLAAAHIRRLAPSLPSGEVQTEAPPSGAALAALRIVVRAMAGNPALRAALLDVAQRGDKIARRQRGQRARWLAYFSAASVLLDGYELDPVKDAPELAALSSPRAVFGIRAWYRRALVELDGQKAGEA